MIGCSAALSAMLASPLARAQAQDEAAARALFEDGRRLLKNGQYPEACRTLEAASKLYPSPGILLNLGDCFEKLGRSASAWTEFGEAAAAATRSRRNDQVSEAKRRLAAVEPKLTRLTIRVASEVSGLVITRDQTDLGSAAWGEAIPVDPGTHEIHAAAPGHDPWSTSVLVSTPGQTVTVDVPALVASPTPPPPIAHESEEPASGMSAMALAEAPPPRPRSNTLGWALIGGGAVAGIVGGVLWDLGANHAREAHDADTGTPAKYGAADSSYKAALVPYYAGIAGVVVGGATATVGVLLVTVGRGGAHRAPSMGAIDASPWISAGGGGLQLRGGF